jgi:hypothetical protein
MQWAHNSLNRKQFNVLGRIWYSVCFAQPIYVPIRKACKQQWVKEYTVILSRCFWGFFYYFFFLLSHYTYNALHIYLEQCQLLPISIHYKVKKFWTDPFFVLDILNSLNITEHSEHGPNIFWTLLNITENSDQILNILNMDWTDSEQIPNTTEHYWKFWTDSEHSEHGLNRFWTDSEHYWTLLKILNRFWTLWTWTEQILNITEHYWKFWTDSEHGLNRFWTDSEQILNITGNSEQILNRFWTFWTLSFFLNQYILLHFH